MSLTEMKQCNPNIRMFDVHDDEFAPFGRVLSMDAQEISAYVSDKYPIPEDRSRYETDLKELHEFAISKRIQKEVFGYLPMQCGLVYGQNKILSGIEYHQGSEVNIAIQDCVLLLGNVQDIVHQHYDASKTTAFYLHQGDVIEVYATTLHYTPIQTSPAGFSTLVYLLEGTNTEISYVPGDMLTKKNKWYMTHATQKAKIELGYIAGLDGDLLQLKYPKE